MISTRAKNKLLDTIQVAWVYSCIALTAGSTAYLGWNFFNYYLYVRPIKKELEEQFKEELLREGRMLKDQSKTLSD